MLLAYWIDGLVYVCVRVDFGHRRDGKADDKLSPSVRTFGVDIEHNFEPVFINIPQKSSTIARLKTAVRPSWWLTLCCR